jgi:phosphoribosyl 1,2-cyclic phosphodiesterase
LKNKQQFNHKRFESLGFSCNFAVVMLQSTIIYPTDHTMKVKFMSLASGSSGNCYYLGYEDHGILIDAGIGIRTIKKHLKDANIPMDSIRGVFVTHDHADHIKAIGHLGEKLHIPIYATALTHKGMDKSYCMTKKLDGSVRFLEKEAPMQCGPFRITSFEVPHDGTDNVGYFIEVNGRFFSFVTDLGEITPLVARYINKANYLILEANYDEDMLETGSYPAYLKQRISGKRGHLSNSAAAGFLAENIREELQYIWLCHLSKDNNLPELACETVACKLREKGIVVGRDVQLLALKRNTPSGLYLLE